MKKTIAIVLIIIITLSVLITHSNAADDDNTVHVNIDYGTNQTMSDVTNGQKKDNYNSLMEDGTTSLVQSDGASSTEKVNTSNNGITTITKIVANLVIVVPAIVNDVVSKIVCGNTKDVFNIFDLLTNKYGLFDINFFEKTDDSLEGAYISNEIKDNIAIWYYSIRNIALVGLVIIAVYIGIRMAISTIADDRAKYKKMLVSWVQGVILVLVLHYLMMLMITVSNKLTEMISISIGNSSTADTIEVQLIDNASSNLNNAKGAMNTVYYLVIYCMFVYYEFKFFLIYIFRVFRVMFYAIISPLVCLTYSIDKVGDDRSQAFNSWIIEMGFTIFKQPIHLFLYMIFIHSAGEIFLTMPVLAIAFLGALSNGEKIIKDVLGLKPQFGGGLKDVLKKGRW